MKVRIRHLRRSGGPGTVKEPLHSRVRGGDVVFGTAATNLI